MNFNKLQISSFLKSVYEAKQIGSLNNPSIINKINKNFLHSKSGISFNEHTPILQSRSFNTQKNSFFNKHLSSYFPSSNYIFKHYFSNNTQNNNSNENIQYKNDSDNSEQASQPQIDNINTLKNELNKLKEQNSIAVEKAKDLQSKLLRCYADQENTRKRLEKEIESTKLYAISNFAKSILEVADNLDRATSSLDTSHLETNEGLKQIYEGVKMTQNVFDDALKKFEVTRYNSIGERFDPSFHEALFEVPDATKETGSVASVLQNGYKIKERILRPAKVGVVKN